MEIVKKTSEYTIVKKRNGRYGVQARGRQWINGEDKVKILLEAGLIKAAEPKPEEPAEEPVAEEAAEASEEAVAEEGEASEEGEAKEG